jgi:hypothetical protein
MCPDESAGNMGHGSRLLEKIEAKIEGGIHI